MGLPRSRRPDQVSALLTAACAPARPGELAGEEAAVAAYRAAGNAPPSPASSQTGRSRRFTAGPTAWLAAVAATAAAGATFAAVSHDTPSRQPETQRITAPAVAQTSAPETAPSDTTRGAPGDTSGANGGTGTASGSAGNPGDAASVAGLCRSYRAQDPARRAAALRTPAFRRLVEAAGGADQVAAYCEDTTSGAGDPDLPGPGGGNPGAGNPGGGNPGAGNPGGTPGGGNPGGNPNPGNPPPANPAEPPGDNPSDKPGKG